ncbi:protein Shroom isoform X2 [Eurosta solidaginis]
MESPLSKNSTNMQKSNNNNNHNQNKACNNNNKSAVNAAPMAPAITTTTTTIETTTTVTTTNISVNNNNNHDSESGGGKITTATTKSVTSANAALTASHTPSININNNINTINTSNTNNNNNNSTSILLRKQFIASSDVSNASFSSASVAGSIQDDMSDQCSLTQAGLEEYNIRASSYYDQPAMLFHHQKQSSYAQSEGYHSYVSSSDSSSATPFLDRLRQESEMLLRQSSHHWSQNDLSSVSCASMASSPTPLLLSTLGRDTAGTGNSSSGKQQHHNNSSESTSSTETLKWLGSMSDVSEASHATGYSAISEAVSSSQLIVHSSRVLTPKRHHSESVLYLHNEHQQQQQLQHQQTQSLPTSSATPHQHSPGAPTIATKQISPTLSARELTHSPTRAAALLPNHRHSPSYPPVHATAAMHPYQPHPQYALHQQPQSVAHKLIAAAPIVDVSLPSSLSADDNCSRTKASPPLPALTTTQPSSAQSSLAQTKSLSISVTTTQRSDEVTSSHSPAAIAAKSVIGTRTGSSDNVEVSAIDGKNSAAHSPGSASNSPGSANSQLNISSTSLASAVSTGSAQSYRGNHRLFPVNTYTEKVHSNTSQFVLHPKPQYSAGLPKPTKQQPAEPETQSAGQNQALQQTLSVAPGSKYMLSPSSPPQPSWQSVAELINDFERTKNEPLSQQYTYMDPGKTHRVSNPALKAFQKNAVQSYFERQQQQQQQQHAKEQIQTTQQNYHPISVHSQQQHSPPPQQQQRQQQLQQQQQQQLQQHIHQLQQKHSPPQPSHHQLLRPHSYSSNLKEAAVQHQIMRNSLPNSYGAAHTHSNVHTSQLQQQTTNAPQHLPGRSCAPPPPPPPQKLNSNNSHSALDERTSYSSTCSPLNVTVNMSQSFSQLSTQSPSPAPPPPPPRSRSLMPHTLLRRSSSASDYAEFRDQYMRATQEKLAAQSVKNISNSEKSSFNDCGMPPPPPPPRGARSTNILGTRRTSSAAQYAAAMREKALLQQAAALAHQQHHPHQHARPPNCVPQYYNPPPPLPAAAATEPGWAPERPPKNPSLRVPSPDLPPLPPSSDLDTQLADEPLPPPPPELLQQQRQQYQEQQLQNFFDLNSSMHTSVELMPKAPSPNRRNSFAGSSTRKSYFGRAHSEISSSQSSTAAAAKMPPLIPRKPSNIDPQLAVRHTPQHHAQLQHAQQQHQVQQYAQHHQHTQQLTAKLLLNGSMPQSQQHSPPSPQTLQALSAITSATNAKLPANRKRAHNPAVSGLSVPPPILENVQHPQQHSPQQLQCGSKSPSNMESSPPPPPLLPRSMPQQPLVSSNSSQTTRCNSKASYLPRQSLEKLNNIDPDHGSYKLTLTSNEDLVANTKPTAYDILNPHSGKLPPNNLPDVLPLGAKLQTQTQSSSPTSANTSPLRYSSNNNLNASTMSAPAQQQQQQQQPVTAPNSYPAYPPTQHRYSTPTMNAYNSNMMSGNKNNNSASKAPSYSRSQSYDMHNSSTHSGSNLYHPSNQHANNSPTKFMSQSTMDLKRTHQLEPTLEETTAALLNESVNVLSPAQSESSLSSPSRHQKHQQHMHAMKSLSSLGSSSNSGSGSTTGSEGRIFRAELVSATLATSPITPTKSVIRKDSLRENIEKITQLQSKLMSAHLSESSLIGSIYGSKTALNPMPATTTTAPTVSAVAAVTQNPHAQSDDSSLKQTSDFSDKAELNEQNSTATHTTAADGDTTEDKFLPTPDTSVTSVALSQPVTTTSNTNTTTDDLAAAKITQLNPSTDGLKLMQRSEIVLRVNPSTTETASQTGDDLVSSSNDGEDHTRLTEQPHGKEEAQQQRITLQPRQRHPIEIDCEEMSLELATLLASNEKLVQILAPPTLKSPIDYVNNLYNPNVPLRPAKRDVGTSTLLRMKGRVDTQEKVLVELQYAEVEVLLTNGESESESSDLLKKKVDELIKQLYRKIDILNEEQVALKEEADLNDELGNSLVNKLTDKVRPIEATKCRTYIDDVGQITSLLLSLSERLARIENSLTTVSDENGPEKKSLELKRDRLLDQLAEAKRLKEDIERRGSSVIGIVEKNLSADEYADFDYFINMKAKLIADTRDIADKIKCGEEQLNALSEALIQSDC